MVEYATNNLCLPHVVIFWLYQPSIVNPCFTIVSNLSTTTFNSDSWSHCFNVKTLWQDSFPKLFCVKYDLRFNCNNIVTWKAKSIFSSWCSRHYLHNSDCSPFRQIVSNITAVFLICRFRHTSNLLFAFGHNYKLTSCIKWLSQCSG